LKEPGQSLPHLPAVGNGRDIAARSEVLYGAWLAGTALGNAQMGVHHSLCHILGGTFGLPHAETHAVVLPHAVAFNQAAARDALAPIAQTLGTGQGGIAATLWDLARSVGAPRSLAELGLTLDNARQAAAHLAGHAVTNPRPVDPDSARELVFACFEGDRPASDGAGMRGQAES
jgi:maleylacetate reductase